VRRAVEKTTEDAERQNRLRALRERHKDSQSETAAESDAAPRWQLSEAGEGSERRREMVKKLIKKRKKRMAQGGPRNKKRMGRGRAAGGASGGERLDQYPRLKALLKKRGGKAGGDSAAGLVELEGRVQQLETALESLLQKLEDAKVLKS
jgi:hypothetical protein